MVSKVNEEQIENHRYISFAGVSRVCTYRLNEYTVSISIHAPIHMI